MRPCSSSVTADRGEHDGVPSTTHSPATPSDGPPSAMGHTKPSSTDSDASLAGESKRDGDASIATTLRTAIKQTNPVTCASTKHYKSKRTHEHARRWKRKSSSGTYEACDKCASGDDDASSSLALSDIGGARTLASNSAWHHAATTGTTPVSPSSEQFSTLLHSCHTARRQ